MSVLLSVWTFSWNCILVFSKFCHGARNLYEVVHDRAGFSREIFFAPKIGKMDQKWTKNGFLDLLKNLLNLFYNKNLYYLLCPAQSFAKFCNYPILQNFCSRDMGQNVPSQSDCRIF